MNPAKPSSHIKNTETGKVPAQAVTVAVSVVDRQLDLLQSTLGASNDNSLAEFPVLLHGRGLCAAPRLWLRRWQPS